MVAACARLGQAIVVDWTGQMCPIENAASRTREQSRPSATCRWQETSRFVDESSATLTLPVYGRVARDSIRIVKAPRNGLSRVGASPWSSDQQLQLPCLFQPAESALIVT